MISTLETDCFLNQFLYREHMVTASLFTAKPDRRLYNILWADKTYLANIKPGAKEPNL